MKLSQIYEFPNYQFRALSLHHGCANQPYLHPVIGYMDFKYMGGSPTSTEYSSNNMAWHPGLSTNLA